MKRIITKYATSSGVTIQECRDVSSGEFQGKVFYTGGEMGFEVVHRIKDCHDNQVSAEARVKELFKKRRASLEKSLRDLDFKERAAMRIISIYNP